MKFILTSAIPLMGKSTYAAKLVRTEKNATIVCPDTIRGQVCGDESDMSRDGFIWNKLIPERLSFEAAERNTVIFDSTDKNEKSRRNIMKMALAAGYTEFECHFIRPNLQVALERNKTRERKLPVEVIERFTREWTEPSLGEGFARIVEIKACQGGESE